MKSSFQTLGAATEKERLSELCLHLLLLGTISLFKRQNNESPFQPALCGWLDMYWFHSSNDHFVRYVGLNVFTRGRYSLIGLLLFFASSWQYD